MEEHYPPRLFLTTVSDEMKRMRLQERDLTNGRPSFNWEVISHSGGGWGGGGGGSKRKSKRVT